MSDDVFVVTTYFADVAELGQGYVTRADGERILLPLPSERRIGEGVRFLVHLRDGTPAFAGAGRCIQVSDQSDAVDASERYETLLDSLVFDDRSRPVYEYIVAVRQAMYEAGGPTEPEAAEQELAPAHPSHEDAPVGEVGAYLETSTDGTPLENVAMVSTVPSSPSVANPAFDESDGDEGSVVEAVGERASFGAEAGELVVDESLGDEAIAALASDESASAYEASEELAYETKPAPAASFEMPEASLALLPTGMLTRPAASAHWQPAAPKPPLPSPGTGMFRYAKGALPVPAQPPRPELDRSLWVQPAPSPSH